MVSLEVRTRRKKAEKASSLPKGPLKETLEAQEELIAQEVEVIEEIQATEIELASIAIFFLSFVNWF